jgi:beta-xylosidase
MFPFGFGMSYTFEVDELRASATEIPTDGELAVSVRVRNTGDRAGPRSSSSTCGMSSPR